MRQPLTAITHTPGRRTCGGTCARLSWTWSLALELQLGTMVKGPLLWESEVHSGCGSLPSLPPSPHCTSRGCGSSPADLLALQLPVEADGRPTLRCGDDEEDDDDDNDGKQQQLCFSGHLALESLQGLRDLT